MDKETKDALGLLHFYSYASGIYDDTREDIEKRGGAAVRVLRKGQRYTLRQFAGIIGVKPSTLSRIENGHALLSPALASKVMDAVDPNMEARQCLTQS